MTVHFVDGNSGARPLAEPARLAQLRQADVLDSPAEESFDRLTRLASRLVGAPVSLASFVDADRQFFKSRAGEIAEPWQSARQTPLSHSFCQHVVTRAQPLVVNDAREHPLVKDNLAIPDLGVVAYAGMPIVTPQGNVLGSFCVIDTRARDWSEEELEILADLSRAASTEIALRLELSRQQAIQHELRRAREAAESAAQAKSEFLANMSHEIRTPMNGILGMTGLVLDSDLNDEQRRYLESVRDSGEALLRIINEILDFSRIEANRLELDPTPVRIGELLADILQSFTLSTAQRDLELTFDVAPEIPDLILIDALRLRQIITNLVGNAVKFTKQGEVAVLVTREQCERGQDWIRLEVRDTGVGIPAHRLEAVFEAFAQAEGSTSRRYGGTGLGLAITRRLVNLMGGEISARSRLGEGSVFAVRLPVEAACSLSMPLTEEQAFLAGARILVADDNERSRRMLQRSVEGWGAEAMVAGSGLEALSAIRDGLSDGAISAAVVDRAMPDADGLEVARAIAARQGAHAPPLILLTAAGDRVDRATAVGVSRVLLKPVRVSELRRVLSEVLGRVAPTAVRGTPSETVVAGVEGADDGSTQALRVLLAEDNRVNQILARALLKKWGCEVTVVEDGIAAVQAVEASEFDLVLMDVQMPELDGLEATERVRVWERDNGRQHARIVALTAHAMAGDEARCLAAGMDGYLTKPLRPEDLQAVVTDAHRGLKR